MVTAAGSYEKLVRRSLNNFDNRCLHHHVFDLNFSKGNKIS